MHKNKKDDTKTNKQNKKNPAKRNTQQPQPQQRQAPKSIPREPGGGGGGGGGGDAKSSCSWAKAVPNAACCIVPPTDKWEAIQELRARFDKSYERWPPHLTLLFPFLPPGQFRAAAEQLRQDHRFASFRPFTVCLDRLLPPTTSRSKYISFHVSESTEGDQLTSTSRVTKTKTTKASTASKEQEDAGHSNLHALRRLLLELFPTCDDEQKEWRPHVTVGQLPQEQLQEQCQLLQNQWTPLRWEVTELCFLARSQGPQSPFTILTTVSLPSASSIASSASSSS